MTCFLRWTNRAARLCIPICCGVVLAFAAVLEAAQAPTNNSPFAIRGTLPWHNFLSGPTAWDEKDYERYLDRMQSLGLNYITFHCYTGGAERYVTYVEPLLRVSCRDTLPEATLDTSLTARWGYRPLGVSDFAFGTGQLFKLPRGAKAFGAECALLARDNRDRYDRAQGLMRRVIQMAHARGMQVGIGFEFGILPPEYLSLLPPGSHVPGTGMPDPTHPAVREVFRATLENLLQDYPNLDWVWLWLHEHTVFVGEAKPGAAFSELMRGDGPLFTEARNEIDRFNGVWSLAYIRAAHEYLAKRAPRVRLAISGWGGGAQLPDTLRGLDRALPSDIVFSCLSPGQGGTPLLPVLGEIAAHREVWAIPWLEGDMALWHLQPRVSLLQEQVKSAAQQHLKGAIAIHWRTEETRANLSMFARAAMDPATVPSVEEFYLRDCTEQFGQEAGPKVANILTRMDREQTLQTVSPEYYCYDPSWGRLSPELRGRLAKHQEELKALVDCSPNRRSQANLQWLADNFEFTLLLDEVSRQIEPAYKLKERWLLGKVPREKLGTEITLARDALAKAPIEQLFRTYARRVRSKGELGELSSLNQKLWLQYRELDQFLRDAGK